MKAQEVVDMLSRDEWVLKKLKEKLRGTTRLVDKQLRMVRYFFEILFDLMIAPDVNLSQNAGFESFIGSWNRAQNC